MAGVTEVRDLPPNTVLVKQGCEAEELFIVGHGVCRAVREVRGASLSGLLADVCARPAAANMVEPPTPPTPYTRLPGEDLVPAEATGSTFGRGPRLSSLGLPGLGGVAGGRRAASGMPSSSSSFLFSGNLSGGESQYGAAAAAFRNGMPGAGSGSRHASIVAGVGGIHPSANSGGLLGSSSHGVAAGGGSSQHGPARGRGVPHLARHPSLTVSTASGGGGGGGGSAPRTPSLLASAASAAGGEPSGGGGLLDGSSFPEATR